MKRIKFLFTSHFLTLMFLEIFEKRGEESLENRELRRAWRSEGGASGMEEEDLGGVKKGFDLQELRI